MTKRAATTTAPRLRFPESMSDSWESKALEEIAPLQRGFDLPSSDLEPGEIPVVYSNGVQHFHSTAMARAPGLVTGRSGTIGKIHFIESGEYWPHNTSLWVTSFKGNVPKFVYYLFNAIGMGRFASGSGVPTLNRNDVHAFLSAVPSSLAEQQKIADCLTSLDEVIAAQRRKVEALKAHKRGLMQQLFPREGETRPSHRFPEFRGAPEWKIKKLSALIDLVSGMHLSPGQYGSSGDVPYFTGPSDFTNEVKCVRKWTAVSSNMAKKYDTLITVKGSGVGECWCLEMPSVAMGRQLMAVHAKASSSQFIHQFLLSKRKRFEDLASGNLIPGLARGDILDMVAPFPEKAEQQRIADCLSSLDAKITAESAQLAALRTHKQGLMQQLFPAQEAG